MTFYERVKELCDQRGVSVTAMARTLGFSASAGTTWKASTNMPRSSTVKTVADYFGLTVDELKEGIDTADNAIDYASVDTSDFNPGAWQKILKDHNYNEKKAIKAYLEFEKTVARDAMAAGSSIFQNNGANYGVIGNSHAPVKIVNGSERTLSDQESELLRIFADLSIVERSKVLIYAAELKDKK